MKRRQRIAVSVFFALVAVAVAVVVLWIRSYSRCNILTRNDGTRTTIGSNSGFIYLTRSQIRIPTVISRRPSSSALFDEPRHGWQSGEVGAHLQAARFAWIRKPTRLTVTVPYWFVTSILVALAFVPWLGPRFSLRTMLIATTLVAIVLVLAVWAGR